MEEIGHTTESKMVIDFLKDNRIIVFVCTLFWQIVCHGYRFTQLCFSHDSLMVVKNDYTWQISLGRFIQPVVEIARGDINTPFLIMCIAAMWLMLAVYFMIRLLNINDYFGIFMVSGLMTCNVTLALVHATYIAWSDLFALALFLAVYSVYNFEKHRRLASVVRTLIALFLMLGIYQAYLGVVLGLVLIQTIRKSECEDIKYVFKYILDWVIITGLSGLIYFIAWKMIVYLGNVTVQDTYNGLSNVKKVFTIEIIQNIKHIYQIIWNDLWNPKVYSVWIDNICSFHIIKVLMRFINIGLIIAMALYIAFKGHRRWLQIVSIICFPMAIYVAGILSGGYISTLMKYSFALVYIMAIAVFKDKARVMRRIIRGGMFYNMEQYSVCKSSIYRKRITRASNVGFNDQYGNQNRKYGGISGRNYTCCICW